MTSPTTPRISDEFADRARQALQRHAAPVDGLQLALLSTPDGFEIACLRIRSELQPNRLSAMASSLMAMASAVGREVQSPSCKRLTFDAEGSTVIFQSVDGRVPCILCLVLGPTAVLGYALWAAGELARDMARH